MGRFIKGYKPDKSVLEKLRLRKSSMLGKKHSISTKLKMSLAKIGKPSNALGHRHTARTKQKISEDNLKRIINLTKEERNERFGFWKGKFGKESSRYIEDRSLLKKENRRNDPAYQGWRRDIYFRDNYNCKINNQDCNGRIEAHHILSWREYPKLRYNINNGVTLCHSHHPRKWEEEKRLISKFQQLVSESSELICH